MKYTVPAEKVFCLAEIPNGLAIQASRTEFRWLSDGQLRPPPFFLTHGDEIFCLFQNSTVQRYLICKTEIAAPENEINALLALHISALNLTRRTENSLVADRTDTIGELTARTQKELLRIPNFGKLSLTEVKEALASKGLTIKA